MKQALVALAFPNAGVVTWKVVRRGVATTMVAEDKPVQQVKAAGAWRSDAYKRYVDDDFADMVQQQNKAVAPAVGGLFSDSDESPSFSDTSSSS